MRNKLSLSLAIILMLALVLGGCSANAYVVKVNDEKIAKKDFDNKLNDVKTSLQTQGMDFTTEEGKTTLQSVQEELIGMLIQGAILKQEVKKNNWDTGISQISDKINQLSTQNGGDLASALKQQGLTEDDLRNALAFSYYVSKDTTVSDQEVKTFFENNLDKYGGQMEQVKARHILVATEDEAKNIIKQIQAGGDFAQIAKEKSTDTGSKDSGGDLGYFSKGKMVAEFENAAFSLKVGEITAAPVKTQFGYHIIQVLDHKQAVAPDFEKVKEKVKADALENAQNQKVESYYDQLYQNTKIEYAKGYEPTNSAQP